MFYEMQIAGLTRQLPLCPLGDSMMIAGFVMFGDVEITVKCAEELLKRAPEFDVIVTAESKGIPLAHEMARQSGKDYVVLRKEPKLYMTNVVKTGVESITTAHIQTLCLGDYERNMIQGRKVLIVDDVISTGGSLLSIEKLVHNVEGEIVGKMAVLPEGDAAQREDIVFLEPLPLFDRNGKPQE